MNGDAVTNKGWKKIGGADFARQFDSGLTRVEIVAIQNEETGEIRLFVEVPNAQIFAMPRDVVPLAQVIMWAIANLVFKHKVMVPNAASLTEFERFDIWRGFCRILNSLDPWVRHAKHDV